MIDPRDFRRAMGRFATGITVVTMRDGDQTHGITVNAFMSVSLEPPLIAVCIDRRANAHATLMEVDRFGVSMLRADQEAVSNRFAGRPVTLADDPFESFAGVDVVTPALAHLVCRRTDAHPAGDHTIFVGEVEALRSFDGRPLLYFQGQYAHVPDLELSE